MPRAKTYGHATALLSGGTERRVKGDAVEMVRLSKEKLSQRRIAERLGLSKRASSCSASRTAGMARSVHGRCPDLLRQCAAVEAGRRT